MFSLVRSTLIGAFSTEFLRNLFQGSPTSYYCLFGLPISRSHEYMYSSSSGHNLRSFSEALECTSSKLCCISSKECTGLVFLISFFSELHQGFHMPAFITVFSFGVISHTFRHRVYLGFSFQTFLATFSPGASFTGVPSSSTLWEISFHFPRNFVLFQSFELCLASSTAERCHLDFEFQSFNDHPACFWDIARLSTAMFFPTFDSGFRFGEAEDGG